MLDLRPVCEHCAKALPPAAPDAMICSFECTFCRDCATGLLKGICPNCGGNFSARPVRPAQDRKGGNSLGTYPATTKLKHRPVDLAAHAQLVAQLETIAPEAR
jgi:uncharacterized protein